ncbi:MAG: hypothetical protein U0797_19285 [Gemmataceae bacterium]
MRRIACATGVSLVLAAALGTVNAQSPLAPASPPGQPSVQPSTGRPYSVPTTPGLPYSPSVVPYSSSPGLIPGAAPPPRPATAPAAPGGPAAAQPTTAPSDPGAASESRGEAGSDALASAAPQMIGDLIGTGAGGVFPVTTSAARQKYIRSIIAARSGIKIADNESPRPLDRVFATFNYFNGVNTFGSDNFGLYRGMVGFEKTFLDGNASVGMRLPFVQGDRESAIGTDGFGDLTMILKYAFINDAATGNVASAGLAITAPTGLDFRLADGTVVSSVIFQPWGGFIYNMDDVFTHGFTSLLIPTQSKDLTLYTLDLGVGYRLWRASDDGLLQAIVPTIETHLNIPFTETGPGSLIYFPDLLMSLTAGLHFNLGGTCWFTLAAGVPITGPQLYDAEFISQLNWRF